MPKLMRRFLPLFLAIVSGGTFAAGAEENPNPVALAKARLELARKLYHETEEELLAPPQQEDGRGDRTLASMERINTWSTRWMEAERDANPGQAGLIAALESHIKRLKRWVDGCAELAGIEKILSPPPDGGHPSVL